VGEGFPSAIYVYRVFARGLVLQQCLAAAPLRNCTVHPLLPAAGVRGLAETPDGSELYAAGTTGSGAERIVGLSRDQASGLLTARSGEGDCASDESDPPAGCTAVTLTGSVLSLSASGDTLYAASGEGYTTFNLAVAALTRDPASGALSEPAGPAGCVVFASALSFAAAPSRGCGTAPRWVADDQYYTASAASGGLFVSAVERHEEHHYHVATVVQVSRSPTGGALVVKDVRECAPGACHHLRGAAGELNGPIASSPGGRSLYMSQGDGIAQLRLRR
jgi:hypothetical protein